MCKTERGEGPAGSLPLPRPRSRRRAPRPGALPGSTRRAIKPTGVNPRRQTKVYKPDDPWIVERPVAVAQTPCPQMPVGPQHVPARASPGLALMGRSAPGLARRPRSCGVAVPVTQHRAQTPQLCQQPPPTSHTGARGARGTAWIRSRRRIRKTKPAARQALACPGAPAIPRGISAVPYGPPGTPSPALRHPAPVPRCAQQDGDGQGKGQAVNPPQRPPRVPSARPAWTLPRLGLVTALGGRCG